MDKNSQFCNMNFMLSTAEFHWKIHNFRLCSQQVDEYITSSIFTSSGSFETKWKLQLYPLGRKDCAGFVGLYLSLIDTTHKNITVDFTLSIIKKDGSLYSLSDIYYNFKCFDLLGYSKFIHRTELMQNLPRNSRTSVEYLQDGMLHIKCKLTSCMKTMTSYNQDSFQLNMKVIHKKLSKDLGVLLKDERFSDLCIKVDGVEFKVHKNILAARSPVFAAMLEHNMKENQENVIQIVDFKPEIIKEMISYIYTGKVNDLKTKAIELFKVADKYDLNELKIICESAISKSLSIDNIEEVLEISELYNSQKLKCKINDFVRFNFSKIVKYNALLDLRNSTLFKITKSLTEKPHLMYYILYIIFRTYVFHVL